jgi:hypothetical protein
MTRQLHFNAFLMGCGHHEAAWRLPQSDPFANLQHPPCQLALGQGHPVNLDSGGGTGAVSA